MEGLYIYIFYLDKVFHYVYKKKKKKFTKVEKLMHVNFFFFFGKTRLSLIRELRSYVSLFIENIKSFVHFRNFILVIAHVSTTCI